MCRGERSRQAYRKEELGVNVLVDVVQAGDCEEAGDEDMV